MADDFRNIETKHGVPPANKRRLNVIIEDGNGEIIGYASGLTNRKWMYLSDLWIHEKIRGQGHGAKILNILENDARAIGITHMHTQTTGFDRNDLFYLKQGYEIAATFENFFDVERGHHFILTKKL